MNVFKTICCSFILLPLLLTHCFFKLNQPIPDLRIKGSDTMHLMMKNLAIEFMKQHPGISIQVDGGGTGGGIKALIQGKVEICAASRVINPTETRIIARKYRRLGVYSIIARDALSIYINPKNPIRNLTIKQLKQIFSGEISNWQEVGGENHSIHVLIRPPSSGTYFYFQEYILEFESYVSNARTIDSTEAIIREIMKNPYAIGYGGMAFGSPEYHIQVNGINPSIENVRYDLYPLSRYLYLYTIKKPVGLAKEFIDWTMSPEGQRMVEQAGFLPLWNPDEL